MKGEMLKDEVLIGPKAGTVLTRPGRLRARSGSKLPTANVPLRALGGWGTKDKLYFLLGYVRHSSGLCDLVYQLI